MLFSKEHLCLRGDFWQCPELFLLVMTVWEGSASNIYWVEVTGVMLSIFKEGKKAHTRKVDRVPDLSSYCWTVLLLSRCSLNLPAKHIASSLAHLCSALAVSLPTCLEIGTLQLSSVTLCEDRSISQCICIVL